MISMSSLGHAGIAWLLQASGLVHLVVCWLLALWLVDWLVRWSDLAGSGNARLDLN